MKFFTNSIYKTSKIDYNGHVAKTGVIILARPKNAVQLADSRIISKFKVMKIYMMVY